MSLSICICTFNRAQSLALTLESLASARAWFKEDDEVIVVNNNSSDHTNEVVGSFRDRLPVRVVHEPTQGLSMARNRALAEAGGDSLIFFDDDVTVSIATLEHYRAAFESMPQFGFFGGQIKVAWRNAAPRWLRSDQMPLIAGFLGRFAPGDSGVETSHSAIEWPGQELLPFGANFGLRRSLVDLVGEFDPALGVSGTDIGRGEETDYLRRALALGFRGRYLPGACVDHRFDENRMRIRYLLRYGIRKGNLLTPASDGINGKTIRILGFVFKGAWQLIKGRRDRFAQSVINVGICIGRPPRK